MDITKLTITELKVLAYDILIQIENAQRNLQLVNAELKKKVDLDKEK